MELQWKERECNGREEEKRLKESVKIMKNKLTHFRAIQLLFKQLNTLRSV